MIALASRLSPLFPICLFLVVSLASALAAGCRAYPLGAVGPADPGGPARPTLPLPAELAARFTPVHPGWGLELSLVESSASYQRYEFRFQTFSEVYLDQRTITGTYYRTLRCPPGVPAPLIVDSPILGGAKDDYLACHVFGGWAAKEGISSFWLNQDADILTGDRDGVELDRLLLDNVLSYRKALDLLVARKEEVDAARLGSFGISLGAVKNVVLIAVEPRLKANVLALGGGDLPRILLESQERMVLRYLRRRRERDGLSPVEVAGELRRELVAEPLVLARYIPPENVLLFLGSFDDKVPYASGLALRRELGRPRLHVIALGHYTGLLAAPYAARKGFAWMARRFREESSTARAAAGPAGPSSGPSRGVEEGH